MNRTAEPARITFDGWTLDPVTGDLWKEGIRQRLPEQPLHILDELIARAGDLVTREQLIARLWPKGVVEFDTGLNTAMRKLRAALGEDANRPRYIETIPRKGYRFICEVTMPAPQAVVEERRSRPDEPVPTSTAAHVAGTAAASSPPSASEARRRQPVLRTHSLKVLAAVTLSLGLCVGALLVWHFSLPSPATHAAPAPVALDLYLAAKARQPDIAVTEDAQPRQRLLDLLGRALAIDPQFAPAYVVRARANLDFFISNLDVSEELLAGIRKDIETASRLSGDPRTGVDVRGLYAALVDLDPEGGLRLAESAPDDPDALQ